MKISEALNLDGLSPEAKEVFNTCEIEPWEVRSDGNIFISRKLKTPSVGEVVAYINEDFYLDSSKKFNCVTTILSIVDILSTMKVDGGYIIRNNENDIEIEFIWYKESFKICKDKGYYILRDYELGFGMFGSGEISVELSLINGMDIMHNYTISEENSAATAIKERFNLSAVGNPNEPHTRCLVNNAVSYLEDTLEIHDGYAVEVNGNNVNIIFPNETRSVNMRPSSVQPYRGGFHDYIADRTEISPALSSIGFSEKDKEDFRRLNANIINNPNLYPLYYSRLRLDPRPSIGEVMAVINNEFELDPESPFSDIDTAIDIHTLLTELGIPYNYHITMNSDTLEVDLYGQKGTILIWRNKGEYFRKRASLINQDESDWDGEYYGEDC